MKKILVIQMTLLSIFTANAVVPDTIISVDQQQHLLKCLNKGDTIEYCSGKSKNPIGIATGDEKVKNKEVLDKLKAALDRKKCNMGTTACNMTPHNGTKLTLEQAEEILKGL